MEESGAVRREWRNKVKTDGVQFFAFAEILFYCPCGNSVFHSAEFFLLYCLLFH